MFCTNITHTQWFMLHYASKRLRSIFASFRVNPGLEIPHSCMQICRTMIPVCPLKRADLPANVHANLRLRGRPALSLWSSFWIATSGHSHPARPWSRSRTRQRSERPRLWPSSRSMNGLFGSRFHRVRRNIVGWESCLVETADFVTKVADRFSPVVHFELTLDSILAS